jgi:hypothetical protein
MEKLNVVEMMNEMKRIMKNCENVKMDKKEIKQIKKLDVRKLSVKIVKSVKMKNCVKSKNERLNDW